MGGGGGVKGEREEGKEGRFGGEGRGRAPPDEVWGRRREEI